MVVPGEETGHILWKGVHEKSTIFHVCACNRRFFCYTKIWKDIEYIAKDVVVPNKLGKAMKGGEGA
jgi:hypothetical protein